MLRPALLVLALLGLLGGVWALMGDRADSRARDRARTESGEKEASNGPDGDKKIRVGGGRGRPGALQAEKGARPMQPQVEYPEEPMAGREFTREESIAMFEGYLMELEEIDRSRQSLNLEDKEKLYRQSSQQLAALTEHFDMRDEEERRYVETNRGLLLAQLKRLGIGPPEPPMRPPGR